MRLYTILQTLINKLKSCETTTGSTSISGTVTSNIASLTSSVTTLDNCRTCTVYDNGTTVTGNKLVCYTGTKTLSISATSTSAKLLTVGEIYTALGVGTVASYRFIEVMNADGTACKAHLRGVSFVSSSDAYYVVFNAPGTACTATIRYTIWAAV